MKFQVGFVACFLACTICGYQQNGYDFEDTGIYSLEANMRMNKRMLEDFVSKFSEEMQNDAPRPQVVTRYDTSEEINGTPSETSDDEPPVGKQMTLNHQIYLQKVFEFHQSIICGMPIKKENREKRISHLYYNYGEYKCDENGEFVLQNCIYGLKKPSISEVQQKLKSAYNQTIDFIFNTSSIAFCSQVAHKYLYSGALNDKEQIWKTQELVCRANRVDAAFYNHKLVTCKDRKYKLIGCLLDKTFISAKILRKVQPDVSETHKDVCLHYGNKQNWAESRRHLIGHNLEIDDGMTIEIAHRIKEHHKTALCKPPPGLSIEVKISYKFGWYFCGRNELKILSCLYGNKTVPVQEIVRTLQAEYGDYISDPNDIRFCAQLAHEYLDAGDSSHEHKTIWRNEDYVCQMAKNETYGAAYYSNFKLYVCDRSGNRHLSACLYDFRIIPTEEVQKIFQSIGQIYDTEHRDFCFQYGNITQEIKTSVIVQRGGRGENGRFIDCSNIQKWPSNTIRYFIAPTNETDVNQIHNVIKMYEDGTCLKFEELAHIPRNNSADFVYIDRGHRCASAVGKLNKTIQRLTYNKLECIIHEFGHLIGLVHEQARSDRDHWVKIDYNRLLAHGKSVPYLMSNYYPCNSYHSTTHSFDFRSVMNYEPGVDGYISRIAIYNRKLNRINLTSCDYKKINAFYECGDDFVDRFKCEPPKRKVR